MVKKAKLQAQRPNMIDVACVIHGQVYSWDYVDRLHNMLSRNLTVPFKLHVYTERHRVVPEPYVKHALIDWSLPSNKKAWWYKMQLFNQDFFQGNLLYLDLDTVIVGNIDWVWQLPTTYFWSVKDFKYLWKSSTYLVNSSMMWWNTRMFDHVWQEFQKQDITEVVRHYHGDQDFVDRYIPQADRRCFDTDKVKSWRWQCFDGGFDFRTRKSREPGRGTYFPPETSVLIFHGQPKPSEIMDPVVRGHWQ